MMILFLNCEMSNCFRKLIMSNSIFVTKVSQVFYWIERPILENENLFYQIR